MNIAANEFAAPIGSASATMQRGTPLMKVTHTSATNVDDERHCRKKRASRNSFIVGRVSLPSDGIAETSA